MDKHEQAHTPLPTEGSVVDPAAEAAKRNLSWSADETPAPEIELNTAADQSYTTYRGLADGSFEVTVVLQHGGLEAIQSVIGHGDTSAAILDALRLAYEKADRALVALLGQAKR